MIKIMKFYQTKYFSKLYKYKKVLNQAIILIEFFLNEDNFTNEK